MMSVHDALTAWRRGVISTEGALQLSGATDVAGLEELCRACDVQAVKRGRADIAAGDSYDIDDVLRELDEIVRGDVESPPTRDS